MISDNSVNPVKKRESVKNDYNIIANEYADEFGRKLEDIEVIEEFMSKLNSNSKILDLGGGTGKLTNLFIQKGHKAICYDFSIEMMRKAKEFFPNIPYILDDMVNIKEHFESSSFDWIIAFYSLFHIPKEELDKVFSSICDLLKQDGIFCFVVQLGDWEDYIDEPYLKEKGKNVLYFNFFTKEQINELLQRYNLEKIYETEKEEAGENELGGNGNNKYFVIAKKKWIK